MTSLRESKPAKSQKVEIDFSTLTRSDLDSHNSTPYMKGLSRGLSEKLVRKISADKHEPRWMLEHRLISLKYFLKAPNPTWGVDLSSLNYENICYYAPLGKKKHAKTWEEVDPEIKKTFDRLKIPEAERAMLAGVGAQYESENVYHNLQEEWAKMGVIFEDFDVALRKYPDKVQKYFMKCVPSTDHKFAALHGAVFSGGTFLYVPSGVKVLRPMQAYFRMNAEGMGQFEHTLIILEDGAEAQYIEGCSAPKYGSNALHAGLVEVFVGKNSKFRYSSVENWSKDTFNLNTKRALVSENARMEWIGGNMGSQATMLYPCSLLVGKNSRAEHLSIAVAGNGQNQDTGAKVILIGENTKASVISKSISKAGGISTYRGLVDVKKTAKNAMVNIECDALLFGKSTSDTVPTIKNASENASITHEASAGKISEEVLFYLESRGLTEEEAKGIIMNGFLEEIIKTLPLEYAVELNRLIEMEMEGSVG
ncbi:Fe-S cluster assembly protein SufB [Candidatus Peregrinibacteria bacterium]|nr:Fe-S cluster assembly protein SufB [Candidatus Peregrinibacteria bacterium]